MMDLEELKEKLKSYKKEDIIVTSHAEIRALVREIDIEKVKENIIHPDKLVAFREKNAQRTNEKKYECYFAYSKTHCHKYVLTVNSKIIIVTIININRDWQRMLR